MLDAVCVGGFLVISALVMLICLVRGRILLRGLLLSAATGLGALWGVSLISAQFPLGVTLNALSGAIAVIYGLPGVVGMMALHLITG